MACPYFATGKLRSQNTKRNAKDDNNEGIDASCPGVDGITYFKYLQLDKILSAQITESASFGRIPAHDETLFIITHQAFELWFKQILHEIDSIRDILTAEYLEERNSLCVISRLNRVIAILKLCSAQFGILGTMTPQDFLDFRDHLGSASGFQSFQFRLLEIRCGVVEELRVAYNRQHFLESFTDEETRLLKKAQSEPSLLHLVNDWLSRTPGLKKQTFDFWSKFKVSVHAMLEEMKATAQEESDEDIREHKHQNYLRCEKNFNELFDEDYHNGLLKRHERRFTYQAMQGALMISFYRDEPRFHLPFQLLQSLMDLDSHFMKFRQDHTSMVQRMVGSKLGTGGSSGYLYLRSTCSDRYKIFLDLLNLSTYLVPRDRIPPLSHRMKRSLSIQNGHIPSDSPFVEEPDSGYHAGSLPSVSISEEGVEKS